MKFSVKSGCHWLVALVLIGQGCQAADTFDEALKIFGMAIEHVSNLLQAAQQNGVVQFKTNTMLTQLGEFTQAINEKQLQKELRREMALLFSQNKKLADEKMELVQQVEEQARRVREAEKEKTALTTAHEKTLQDLRRELELKRNEQEVLWKGEKTSYEQKQKEFETQISAQKTMMEKEKTELLTQLQSEKNITQKISQELAALKAKQAETEKQVDSSKKTLEVVQKEFATKQQQLQEDLKRMQQVETERAQAVAQVKELELKKQKLEQDMAQVRIQSETVGKEKAQIATQLSESQQQVASQQAELAKQEEMIRNQTEQLTALTNAKAALTNQKQQLEATVEQDKQAQTKLQSTIEQQKTSIDRLNNELRVNKQQLEEKGKELLNQKQIFEKQVAMSKGREEKLFKMAQQINQQPLAVSGEWNEKFGEKKIVKNFPNATSRFKLGLQSNEEDNDEPSTSYTTGEFLQPKKFENVVELPSSTMSKSLTQENKTFTQQGITPIKRFTPPTGAGEEQSRLLKNMVGLIGQGKQ